MCSVFGLSSGWMSVFGLSADLVGVALLGADLIRVQRMLRANAAAEFGHFNEMAEQYGGAESWAKDIKKNARWVGQSAYEDYHIEDEVSFNAREAKEGLSELSDCVSALADHLAEIVKLSQKKVEGDITTAKTSLLWSWLGLAFIIIGFAGQVISSWPCS